jgi:hypothetical protein
MFDVYCKRTDKRFSEMETNFQEEVRGQRERYDKALQDALSRDGAVGAAIALANQNLEGTFKAIVDSFSQEINGRIEQEIAGHFRAPLEHLSGKVKALQKYFDDTVETLRTIFAPGSREALAVDDTRLHGRRAMADVDLLQLPPIPARQRVLAGSSRPPVTAAAALRASKRRVTSVISAEHRGLSGSSDNPLLVDDEDGAARVKRCRTDGQQQPSHGGA